MVEIVSSNVSRTIQTKLVLPPDTNHLGTIFGGTVLSYIDEIAAIAAMKHSKRTVVTAAIDTVNFVSSAKSGDILTLEAFVLSTGNTSMKVYVKVESHDLAIDEKKLTTTSTVTLVALDENEKPTPVPKVKLESDWEKALLMNN
ncbi:acyl-CoA thioesterase [Siminovitchia fortis]|uniref:acyl-CoA thioesterase n=1 Tax=Siminovitchia fortis TaxID=254758 RepID=UPI00119DE308|nr:acyl-CoA thioesterase [Siminovitchia fortis]